MYVASGAWYAYQVCSNDDIGLLLDFLWQVKFALVTAMGNCSEPFGNISLHVLAWRHFFVTSVSIAMMLDGVMSFSRIKILQKTCKRFCYSQSS